MLFGLGLMQVVFATDTLALGVNMPARTVVIGRMSKWDGRRRRVLKPNEFQQMAGRAGRRGMDAFGHVVVPYSPWLPFREMLTIATGPLEPVRSAFAVRYNTVLNLWDPPDGDRVRNMLQQSLAQYQAGQRIRQLEDDIIEIGGDIIGVRKGCLIGLPDGDDLLEDYRLLIGTRTTAEQKERRIAQQVADIEQSLESAPWPEPGRQALRKVLRTANPGLIVHDRSRGWGVYLARTDAGVGLFLFDRSIQIVPEYRSIDYVFDQRIDKVPESLITVEDSVEDVVAGKLVTGRQLSAFWTRVRKLGLPDLAAMRREHRRLEEERVAHELAGVAQALEDHAESSLPRSIGRVRSIPAIPARCERSIVTIFAGSTIWRKSARCWKACWNEKRTPRKHEFAESSVVFARCSTGLAISIAVIPPKRRTCWPACSITTRSFCASWSTGACSTICRQKIWPRSSPGSVSTATSGMPTTSRSAGS